MTVEGGDAEEGTVPVTVVTGALGAGKTTLVNRLLTAPGDRRIALIVNDVGEVNVDAELVEAEEDGIVDLSNGCICCRLRDDLVTEAARLARERTFDYLVIEASGISEPVPIARTLTVGSEDGPDPADDYRLDTVVTVVDAYGFWKEFDAGADLPPGHDPDRPLADVLVDGIEFCDVLLLNKCDMVPDDVLEEIEAVIRRLQPRAALHRTTHSDVPPDAVLGTGRFDFEAASREQGWKRELAGGGRDDGGGDDHGYDGGHGHGDGHDHDRDRSAAEAHGVESFVYERDRPFHSRRFADWLDDWDGAIVRAKGFCWLASRPEEVIGLNQAGPSLRVGPIGEWGEDDPVTRLVFIGSDLDPERRRTELDACLLGADERDVAADADPFPRETLLK
ncbi:CobW family GTP-binding protein [Halomarina pelagica]|uniref:CobW family GTP-binding protein n=1 Tax=Halomarina pelagica TaxID=2961599 RepID=UPI0020C53ADD|nr:GTP-binding protein [Halomarina sp. BND7]